MNAIVREVFEILHRTAAMRAQLIAILSDGDLAYRLPGGNLTLGELCRDIGLVERSRSTSRQRGLAEAGGRDAARWQPRVGPSPVVAPST
jgi:hypothetical protein